MRILLNYFDSWGWLWRGLSIQILLKSGWVYIVCALLSGCSSFLAEQALCPKTAILAEFSKSLDVEKGTPIRTEIDSITPQCQKEGNDILIDMRLRFTSLRPLLSTHMPTTLYPSYFVAVLDKEGQILSRTDHTLDASFAEKQATKVNFESLKIKVPSQPEIAVYVGFNLDEAQLDLLRKEREKKLHDHRRQPH